MIKHHHHDHDRSACHALLGGLSDYLDGEAEQALCDEIERHMEDCEDCRVVIDTLAKTITLYREHGHTPLPDDARQRLYAALDLSDYLEGH
jgi:predicted anti-sigma-YlaC factor YlaD